MEFKKLDNKTFNNQTSATLCVDMGFDEVVENLYGNNINYFYISLNPRDILEAIEDEYEMASKLNLDLVCIMPQYIYIAIY